jgi:hypothetical protein
VQTLRLCPNQGWPRHRPDKLANTQQNPAFIQLTIHRVDPSLGCRRRDRITPFFTAAQNVRFWHLADISMLSGNVRFWG